jgi:hypothetical protein
MSTFPITVSNRTIVLASLLLGSHHAATIIAPNATRQRQPVLTVAVLIPASICVDIAIQ